MNDQVNQIAMNLETLSTSLRTAKNLMLSADDVGVSVSDCALLVGTIQEQMHEQIKQLYLCNGQDGES